MSSVAPVSAQLSSAMTFSTGAVGGAAASASQSTLAPSETGTLSETGATTGANGALGVQTSMLMQSTQGANSVDQLAALALALLLGKSSEAKNNEDPWKMLVAMAMLSGISGQGSNVSMSMSQNVSVSPEAYAAGAVTAGANVNVQG